VRRRPIRTGYSGTVYAKDDGQLVQSNIEQDLVDSPGQEAAVNRYDRSEAAHGHTCSRCDCVLFGDTNIKRTIREPFCERKQTGAVGHCCGQRNELRNPFTSLDQGFGERFGVFASRRGRRRCRC
jgi:hypothetical protein